MVDYAVEIDLDNMNTSHTQILDLVGRDRTVLDIGCWTGDVGRALIRQGCRVSGAEIDPRAAEAAALDLDRVVVLNLDTDRLSDHFPDGAFDVIVLGDVLEHLMNPVAALKQAARLLSSEGRFVVSIPNITHGSVRLALLQGTWRYTETGLLDQTHIKFFSREGLFQMARDADLIVDDLRATLADPLSVEVVVDGSRLPAAVVEWVREQRDALAYQFVFSARPMSAGEELTEPALTTAARPEAVRVRDEHTEAMAADLEVRRSLLTVRDHIIGLEASATAAAARADRTAGRARRLRERLTEAKKLNERLRKRVAVLEQRLAETETLSVPRHVRRAVGTRIRRW